MQRDISILLIEDEELWSHKISYDLGQFGFNVISTVDCVEDALPVIRRNDFDIALVDIHLNGRNSGIELGKMIHDVAKKPFIFITGSQEGLTEQASAAHPSALLTKPVHTTALFVSIQSAIYHFQYARRDEPQQAKNVESLFFFIKYGNRYKKVDWADIICLRSEKNYTSVVTHSQETFLIRSSLQRTLQYLIPPSLQENFIQVNRAEVLQIGFIDEIIGDEAIVRQRSFSITSNYGKHLKQRLNIIL